MSGIQQLLLAGGGAAVPVDPYFYSVTSLLHGDGTNGGQNNTFLDSSSNNFTITRNGNTTQGSFSPFSQTGWSYYFPNGPTGTSSVNFPDNAGFDFAGGDFTVEAWIYMTSPRTGTVGGTGIDIGVVYAQCANLADNSNRSHALQILDTGIRFYWTTNGLSDNSITYNCTVPQNQWTHVAFSRSGNTLYGFLNGTLVGSSSFTATIFNSSANLYVGTFGAYPISDGYTGLTFPGYISNLRIVKGTGLYTSSFTPSVTPLTAVSGTQLLTCQSNRFIDTSANAAVPTTTTSPSVQPFSLFNPITPYSTSAVGGSGYFDGSGDYLNFTDSSNVLDLGGAQDSFECWIYPLTSQPSVSGMLMYKSGGSPNWNTTDGIEYLLYYYQSQFNFLYNSAGSPVTITSGGSYAPNQWYHVAVATNASNAISLYINGTRVATGTNAITKPTTRTTVRVGVDDTTNVNYFNGYISGSRFINGSGAYDASQTTITVPTAPVTAVTNTALLLNYTNGAIFDNAAVADYETVGNAQISTSVKKYGTGSMAFDGTGDYLAAPSTVQWDFGDGDFTIELWFYANTVATSFQGFCGRRASAASFGPFSMGLSTSSILFSLSTSGSSWALNSTGGTVAANQWYHVAFVRSGTSCKAYLNGTQIISGTVSGSLVSSTQRLSVGSFSSDGSDPLNGYIDDLRISKGVARYTYNFTPPTAEFPNIGGTVTLTADPYFEYTTLLLPGNGTNGAQNNTFLDSSTNAFTITRNGNTTQGTFSPFSQTGWGNYLNGSTDYLTAASNAAFAVPAEYTVEFWAYQVASPTNYASYFMVNVSGGLQIGFDTAGGGVFGVANNFIGWQLTTAAFPLNQWTHVAITRDSSNVTRIFYNGTQQTSGTITTSYAQGELRIGNSGVNNGFINGYVSNMRYLKGTALYTSNFTPPTSPLTAISNTQLLTCQSNRFIDNSSNAFALTTTGSPSIQAFSPFNPTAVWSAATNGGSGYFDGSGDYLNTSSTQVIPSGSFTVEAFVYPTSSSDSYAVAQGTTGNAGRFSLGITSSLWYVQIGTAQVNAGSVVLNQWTHLAATFNGTTLTLYVNGTSVGTAATTTNAQNTTLRIGSLGPADWGTFYWTGYIGQVRVSNTVRTISVPTAPYSSDGNTTFLASYTNAGIYDATSKNDLETAGNAQISTTQSKFGGSSMYFDGTGDYLVSNPATSNLYAFGTGDFTIEFWLYLNTTAGDPFFIDFRPTSTQGAYPTLYSSSGTLRYYANTADLITGGTLTTGTWLHIALCRYSGSTRMFINGSQTGSTYADSINYLCPAGRPFIGIDSRATLGALNGYIDDLRITKGIARYTSNFTPPTTAFLTL